MTLVKEGLASEDNNRVPEDNDDALAALNRLVGVQKGHAYV